VQKFLAVITVLSLRYSAFVCRCPLTLWAPLHTAGGSDCSVRGRVCDKNEEVCDNNLEGSTPVAVMDELRTNGFFHGIEAENDCDGFAPVGSLRLGIKEHE
jgi:hypothetical protein